MQVVKLLDLLTESLYPVLLTERHVNNLKRQGSSSFNMTLAERQATRGIYKKEKPSELIRDILDGTSVIAKIDPNYLGQPTLVLIVTPYTMRGGQVFDEPKVEKVPKKSSISLKMFKSACFKAFPTLEKSGITSNVELEQLAESLGLENFAVACNLSDLSREKINEGEYFIVNISRKPDEVGHWTAAARRDGTNYYFDSFGCTPPKEVAEFLHHKYLAGDAETQKIEQQDCGFRALYVISCLQAGQSYVDIIENLCD